MTSISRRNLLRAGLAGGVVGVAGGAPAFSSAGSRPVLTHGVQSGDPLGRSAVVWSRADRPGRLWVQVSRRPDFRGSRVLRGPIVTPDTDFTGKLTLRGLPAGERLHYRVRAESLDRPGLFGAPVSGSLRTAPARRQNVRFVWTGDVVGQGWGIDPTAGDGDAARRPVNAGERTRGWPVSLSSRRRRTGHHRGASGRTGPTPLVEPGVLYRHVRKPANERAPPGEPSEVVPRAPSGLVLAVTTTA